MVILRLVFGTKARHLPLHDMMANRDWRRLTHGGMVLLLLICALGCASTSNQPPAVEYQGPIEEPKKKSNFWSVLGFIVAPLANFLSAKDKPPP